jgi:hypothetical protein
VPQLAWRAAAAGVAVDPVLGVVADGGVGKRDGGVGVRVSTTTNSNAI